MVRPLIGITCDVEDKQNRGIATRHDLLAHYYSAAVRKAGGLPVLLPPCPPELAGDYLAHVQGLVLSGGDYDVPPEMYGEARHDKLGPISEVRTAFELALLRLCDERDFPVLGVCGGMQLMNVFRGGSLYQDLPSQRPDKQVHSQKHDKREASHRVALVDTRFRQWFDADATQVNSTHHQAVKQIGRGLTVAGRDDEDLVEAFHDPAKKFFVGVQWHPEALHHAHGVVPYRELIAATR